MRFWDGLFKVFVNNALTKDNKPQYDPYNHNQVQQYFVFGKLLIFGPKTIILFFLLSCFHSATNVKIISRLCYLSGRKTAHLV